MIAPERGIIAYTDRYLLARDVSADYAAKLRYRIGLFAEWCRRDLLIDQLTCDLANAWLAELQRDPRIGQRTVYDYRAALRCVWQEAYDQGDTDTPPLRLRKLKKPKLIVEAYTHEEIGLLLAHAAEIKGRLNNGDKRSDFWQAAIHVGYSCGPRRGDLLDLLRSQVSRDGVVSFIQHKTGDPHTVRLSKAARQFAGRLKGGKHLLPWPHEKDWFSKSFSRLRLAAGVHRGSFKWIRRSAGSYAERERPGSGSRLLGHRCERVFRAHYEDTSITQSEPAEPPPLHE